MDRFVYYSKPKLIASWTPVALIATLTVWVGSVVAALIRVAICGLLFLALVLKFGPIHKPQLEISNTDVAYGPGLGLRIPLSSIKYAFAGGPVGSDAWPGSTSVVLEMEARVVAGQRYFDRKVIQLFCVNTSASEIANHINKVLQVSRHDG